MQLMPSGLSRSVLGLGDLELEAMAPRITSLAGALWTPRVSSLRAQMPAMWPHGGTKTFRPVGGSMTLIHGQYSAAYFES